MDACAFQHAQTFRLLAQDLNGRLTVERLADHLSALADIVLAATLEHCWAQMHGEAKLAPPKFAIIGYGKLGGKELGYASDLDLVFLYDDPDESAPDTRASQTGQHLTHQRDGGGAPLRYRPALAARRSQRARRIELVRVLPLPARRCVDLGASGAHARAVRRRRREHRRRLRDRTPGDPAQPSPAAAAPRRRRRNAPQDVRGPSEQERAVRSQARPRRHGHASSPCIPGLLHAGYPPLTRNVGNIAASRSGEPGPRPSAARRSCRADAYREYRRPAPDWLQAPLGGSSRG